MSDTSYARPVFGGPSIAEAFGYRALFLIIFLVSLAGLAIARTFGRTGTASPWQAARQAAHATAGYTLKY